MTNSVIPISGIYQAALQSLTTEPRWLVWSWEWRMAKNGKGKWTKPPRPARDPKYNARSNDPSTWGPYDDAVVAVQRGNADGIGYALLGAGIGAIDLDHVIDGEGHPIHWASQICTEANGAYQETTVSGGGLRIIGTTNGLETHRKFTFDRGTGAGIELYGTPRVTSQYPALKRAPVPNFHTWMTSSIGWWRAMPMAKKQEARWISTGLGHSAPVTTIISFEMACPKARVSRCHCGCSPPPSSA